MLQPGDPVPSATVFRNPGESVSVPELAAEGPILLVFYLFDWSST